jgi:6-pyruvoyltetrahydropterin/6-carboxytetrahydropterin synthase
VYEVVVKAEFAAAHRLKEYGGTCERLHGHNWHVEARVTAAQVNALGLAIDFREVKRHLTAVLDELDHQYLNDLPAFRKRNPSTEHIAKAIYEGLEGRLPAGVKMQSVTAWESERCGVTYRPE